MMNTVVKIVIPALAAAIISLSARTVLADTDVPVIDLTLHPYQDTSMHDGRVIADARVKYLAPHSGFLVWLAAESRDSSAGRYVLVGKRHPSHRLMVRLTGEGWVATTQENSSGVIKLTPEAKASLDIVADGNQEVAADQYTITANVLTLAP